MSVIAASSTRTVANPPAAGSEDPKETGMSRLRMSWTVEAGQLVCHWSAVQEQVPPMLVRE